ncbi:uncharacterized protein BDZ99DRAFT_125563 [Mytilinidion resinicola]|uniref:Zn(2)-C6 fungal-type domain-containing protein n=1 Tax=Mytilinidion resinicola TaxID=574789 RepID=A0A6A6Z6Q1_9PEZI|nr:uncharacterized protein BDZ99DRAFT_125563 [Mytilinidion resinicola]KAF2815915.1 hypothetical protein BDZ99DRAFT_125563 [Mytilinidion resinicola]
MANPIDPRLYGAQLHTAPQGYSNNAGLQNNGAAQQPYYLPPTTTQKHQPALGALDPALERPSPSLREPSSDIENSVEGDSHDRSNGRSPIDLKRPRACDSCRGLKVRCDQERPDLTCKRCAKANRQCVTTPPTRKRTKKADSRVAELERKIDALTASLEAQKSRGPPEGRPYGHLSSPYDVPSVQSHGEHSTYGAPPHDWQGTPTSYGHGRPASGGPDAKRRRLDNGRGQTTIPEDMDDIHKDMAEIPNVDTIQQDHPWAVPKKERCKRKGPNTDHSYINGLIDKLMSREAAEKIFARYVNDISPHFPAVPLVPGTPAAQIREQQPLLFLAIMAGSCHGSTEQIVPQEVQKELTTLLKDEFANIIWRNGEKSLEIVQALHLGVLWYRPPLHYEQHNFYMMVNCAAVMALDLGLDRRTTPSVMKMGVGPFNRRNSPNTNSVEARRTFLVCYYLCMSITMVLRRPILIRWTKFMDESVQILEKSPEALPSDRVLCHHIRLAHIGEQVSVAFSMDDPSLDIAISEPRVIDQLKTYENDLKLLKEARPVDNGDPAIRLGEHVTNLYIHEIALHNNQSPAMFQPPFSNDAFAKFGKQDLVGPAHSTALSECLTATHGILDTILGVPLDTLLTLPVLFCVRAIYAIVCLMKMWVAVSSPGNMSSVVKKEDLKIEAYTEELVKMFMSIVASDAQSPHGKFYYVARRLQDKFVQIRGGTAKGNMDVQSETSREEQLSTIAPELRSHPSHSRAPANPTPLHLLSEAAVIDSRNAAPTPHVQQAMRPQMQQPVQQMSQPPPWYNATGIATTQSLAPSFDQTFDIGNFDFNLGLDADMSAYFLPDGALWNFPDPGFQNYDGTF